MAVLAAPQAKPAQRSAGKVGAAARASPVLQPKLEVGPSHDRFEAEADRVAASVVSPSGPATQIARLACTHAANTCMTAVDSIHNAAGTSALYLDSPLERKLRDAHGCATHRWVAHPIYSELGKIFLGHDAPAEFAG